MLTQRFKYYNNLANQMMLPNVSSLLLDSMKKDSEVGAFLESAHPDLKTKFMRIASDMQQLLVPKEREAYQFALLNMADSRGYSIMAYLDKQNRRLGQYLENNMQSFIEIADAYTLYKKGITPKKKIEKPVTKNEPSNNSEKVAKFFEQMKNNLTGAFYNVEFSPSAISEYIEKHFKEESAPQLRTRPIAPAFTSAKNKEDFNDPAMVAKIAEQMVKNPTGAVIFYNCTPRAVVEYIENHPELQQKKENIKISR